MLKIVGSVAALLLLSFVPGATALGCTSGPLDSFVCVEERESGTDPCENDYHWGRTTVFVGVSNGPGAVLGGQRYCANWPGHHQEYHGVWLSAWAHSEWVSVSYVSYETPWGDSGCFTNVGVSRLGHVDLGCPAGPLPQPAWGSLLP